MNEAGAKDLLKYVKQKAGYNFEKKKTLLQGIRNNLLFTRVKKKKKKKEQAKFFKITLNAIPGCFDFCFSL